MSDTQTHAAAAADEPTAIVTPDAALTYPAELAWSQTDDFDVVTERYSWPSTLTRAGLLTLAASIVAGLIAVAGLVWMVTPTRHDAAPVPPPAVLPHAEAPQTPPQTLPQTPPVVTPSPPVQQEQPPAPDVPVPDQAFAKAMEADGITAVNNDWPQLIYNAHRICWGFAHNISRAEIMKETQGVSHLPDQGVNDYVGFATAFYCPQYGGA